MSNREQKLEVALHTILDNVDYTVHACRLTDMVGACLSAEVIDNAREALDYTNKLEVKKLLEELEMLIVTVLSIDYERSDQDYERFSPDFNAADRAKVICKQLLS